MKEYPVGSVCKFKNLESLHVDFRGKECTIVGGLKVRKAKSMVTGIVTERERYLLHVQGMGNKECATTHDALILIRPPKGEKFEEFMQSVLKPVDLRDVEAVK